MATCYSSNRKLVLNLFKVYRIFNNSNHTSASFTGVKERTSHVLLVKLDLNSMPVIFHLGNMPAVFQNLLGARYCVTEQHSMKRTENLLWRSQLSI